LYISSGDVDGSVEAVVDALKTYKSDKIKLSILHAAVGQVTEYDVKMAQSFKGTGC
jgi:translation initiation factor IF-2